MYIALDMINTLFPLVIVGGIVVFVILRMKKKYENGTLGKKKSKSDQILLDSLIPFGLMSGLAIAVLLNIFFPISLLTAINWATGFGFLFGYFAYEAYSKKEDSYS